MMKGLLMREFYALMGIGKLYILLILFFLVITTLSGGEFFMAVISGVLAGLIPFTILSYDEKDGWDKYCNTMPVTRAHYVAANYIVGFISVIAVAVLNSILLCFINTAISNHILWFAMILAFGLITPSITLPIIYKFGVVKGKILNMCIGALAGGASALVSNVFLNKDGYMYSVLNPYSINSSVWIGLVAVTLAIYVLSCVLSIAVYQKREI